MTYDDYFTQWSSKKKSAKHFAHTYLEKPAIWSLLDKANYDSILDLGCGSGEEIPSLLKHAKSVTGLDSSDGLLNIARLNNPMVKFITQDLNTDPVIEGFYDLIFSSLTLHYIKNWDYLLKGIYNALNKGGELIFSTHHPIKWGSETEKNKEYNEFLLGYKKVKNSDKDYIVYGDYLNTYEIKEKLFQQLDITHYNRPISAMIKSFHNAGFRIVAMLEPTPIIESKSVVLDFYEVHSRIPLFLVWKLVKE